MSEITEHPLFEKLNSLLVNTKVLATRAEALDKEVVKCVRQTETNTLGVAKNTLETGKLSREIEKIATGIEEIKKDVTKNSINNAKIRSELDTEIRVKIRNIAFIPIVISIIGIIVSVIISWKSKGG